MNLGSNKAHPIGETVPTAFGEAFSYYSQADPLVLEEGQFEIRIFYVSLRTSPDPSNVTRVTLHFRFDTNEMWIGSLSVATPFRLIGLGRQLVEAAETIARAIGIPSVKVYPFTSARSFWEKMGYCPHRCTARVLSKDVHIDQLVKQQTRRTLYEMVQY